MAFTLTQADHPVYAGAVTLRIPQYIVATSKVLCLPELLEHILGFLSPEDLLNAQMICREMRNVIRSSPPLQRRLFRRPDDNSRITVSPWNIRSLDTKMLHQRGQSVISIWCKLEDFDGAQIAWQHPELRTLLVRQPPAHHVTMRRDCECDYAADSTYNLQLRPNDALVWGDIFGLIGLAFKDEANCAMCANLYQCRIYVKESASIGAPGAGDDD